MEIVKLTLWNIFYILTIGRSIFGLEKSENLSDSTKALDFYQGFSLSVDHDDLKIKFDVEKMFPDTAIQSRNHNQQQQGGGEETKKPKPLMQRIGLMVVMIPMILQMLSLPAAIASIKMSLLRSIAVGKLALILMLYNILKSQLTPSEVVVVHHSPPQHHDHYYPHTHYEDEDDGEGWFG